MLHLFQSPCAKHNIICIVWVLCQLVFALIPLYVFYLTLTLLPLAHLFQTVSLLIPHIKYKGYFVLVAEFS